jgi:hypothetical protein
MKNVCKTQRKENQEVIIYDVFMCMNKKKQYNKNKLKAKGSVESL